VISVAFKTRLKNKNAKLLCTVLIQLHSSIDPKAVLFSHQAVPRIFQQNCARGLNMLVTTKGSQSSFTVNVKAK